MAFEELLNDPVIQKYLHELVGPTGMPVAAAPPDGEVTDEELAEELGSNSTTCAARCLFSTRTTSRRTAAPRRGLRLAHLPLDLPLREHPRDTSKRRCTASSTALEERLDYERNHEFYLSEPAGIRFEFSEAMEHGFQCPETGAQLERWTTPASSPRWRIASRSLATN